MSVTFAPLGKFLMLSVKSYVLPNSTISSIASTVGIGVITAACFCTIIVDFTSLIDPSEYFTIIVASNFPAVFVSGFSLNSNVVFSGKSCLFAINSDASTFSPSRILISLPVGSFVSASDLFTITFTVTTLVAPFSNVTLIFPM